MPIPQISQVEISSSLIQDLFVNQARAHPQRTCLEFNGRSATYREVERNSAAIARNLIRSGVHARDLIAVVASRCDALVWTLLGVLRSGAAFVVIDSAYPLNRIQALLKFADPRFVVLCSDSIEALDLRLDPDKVLYHSQLVEVPDEAQELGPDGLTPRSHAYCLFTSGTTGNPKCVACYHTPLVNFIAWQIETFDLRETDRFSMLSGLSHDPVLRDIFTPLALGATLVIPPQSTITSVGGLRQFLREKRVSVVHLTPPLGELISASRDNSPLLIDIRHFFWGGDKLSSDMVATMRGIAPSAQHTNFYGSTETPQAAAFYRCTSTLPEKTVPIGKGTRGFDLRIVDSARNPVRNGEAGEIAIASRFLSLGYYEKGQISDPCDHDQNYPDLRIYYTGDLGRLMEDGNAQILGRSDDQVKIRGYRVDLSEVTALLATHPEIQSAIALSFGPEGRKKLGAFVSLKAGQSCTAQDLSQFAASNLPSYMVPAEFYFYDHLPLLPNGKIDRESLLDKANATQSAEPAKPNLLDDASALGKLMKEWSVSLQRSDITPESTFNGLGGDSLTYVQAYLAAEKVLGRVPENWQTVPIGELATLAARKNPLLAQIDGAIALRALSMILVVLVHAYHLELGNGATTALFMVSGFLFGKSMSEELFDASRTRKLLQPLRHLLLPTAVFSILGSSYVLLKYHVLFPASFVMMADTIPQTNIHNYIDAYSAWYLQALIKIIIAAACIQAVMGRFRLSQARQFQSLVTIAAALCAVRLALPHVVQMAFPHSYNIDVEECVKNYNFISNLALFYIGVSLTRLKSAASKALFTAACAAYGLLCVSDFGLATNLIFMLCVVTMLFFPRLYIPRLVSGLLYAVAAHSMYIYLTHFWFLHSWPNGAHALSLPEFWMRWTPVPYATCGGIIFSLGIKRLQQWMGSNGRTPALSAEWSEDTGEVQ